MADKQVIIDIAVNSTQAVNAIRQARDEVDKLKAANKELAESGEKNSEQYIANEAAIRSYTESIKANQKEIDNNIKKDKANKDSLNSLRAELSNLIKGYDNLSAAERNGAKGEELLNKIKATTETVKLAEEETGRFRSSVGNYPTVFSVADTSMGKFAAMFQSITGDAKTAGQAVTGAAKNVALFGKQLWALVKIPIVAIISLIAAVVMQLVKAFKKNDDAMTALQQSFAVFEPILEFFKGVLEAIVKGITFVINGITKLNTAILSLIPGFKSASEAAQQLVLDEDALEDVERQYTVASAERQRDIAEIREKVADKEKYTAAERQKMLKEAMALEEQELKEAMEIAQEKYRIAEEKARKDKDTSDETKNELAQLKADSIKIEADYYAVMRKLQKEYQRYVDEDKREQAEKEKQEQEEKKRRAEQWKQMKATELSEQRKLEDLQLAALAEGLDKSEKMLMAAARRSIEDIDKKIKEGGLTKQTIAALKAQKKIIEDTLTVDIAKLHTDKAENDFAESLQRMVDLNKNKLETIGNDEKKQLDQKIRVLDAEMMVDLNNAKLTEEQKTEINAKYANRRLKLEEEFEQKKAEMREEYVKTSLTTMLKKELEAVEGNEVAKSHVLYNEAVRQLDIANGKSAEIKALTEEEALEMYGTVEAWQLKIAQADAAVVDANAEVNESYKTLKKAQADMQMSAIDAANSIIGTFSDLASSMAETDERYQRFATGMAMAEIITSSAVAIAKAVYAGVQAGGFTGPAAVATIPIFVAELVGIVGAGISSAMATLNKAKQSVSSYADGGLVTGPGTGKSDSIRANLSNGEFVMNAEATRRFLPSLVAMNGGIGRGGRSFAEGGLVGLDALNSAYSSVSLTDAVAAAVAEIHPVVSVRDITSMQRRTIVKENISKS